MLSIWNQFLALLLTTVIACRCAWLPIEARLPIKVRLPIEVRLSVEASPPIEERLPQIVDDTPADTPILLEETTTTPAPTAIELGTTSTTTEIQTNKPANLCTYEQKTYAVNEQFSPDPCTSCSCKEGNMTECAIMSCMECISGPPIDVEGQCCPVCETTTTTEYTTMSTHTITTSCEENGKIYLDGERYQRDVCTTCWCERGQSECATMSCLRCDGERLFIADQCCPDCHKIQQHTPSWMEEPCIYNGMVYYPSDTFSPDPCTSCTCERGGNPFCEKMECEYCNGEAFPVPDQCCPQCIPLITPSWMEEPCNFNGMVYYPGDSFSPDPCTSCTCEKGGNPVCETMECEYCNGEAAPVPDQCCPQCIPLSTPGTPGDTCCEYDKEIYHLGEEFFPDPCTFCRCDESGEAVCAIKDCAQCYGVAIPVPGQCCPDCIPYTTPATPVETCCEYDGEVYRFGEEFSPNSCTFCKCEAGGEPVCAVMDCARCGGESIHVEGQCCPVCRPFPFETAEMPKAEPECDSK